MLSSYDAIYLSPHLDDAVLSCGGQIYQQTRSGLSILIVTITAGDPPDNELSDFAKSLHHRWETPTEAVAIRRTEDRQACTLLGADFLHWNILDCIYRLHPFSGEALYSSEESLFGPLHPIESPLVRDLAQLISQLPEWDQLLIPISAGYHVDHQLTRQAAEQFLGPVRKSYYEEYPYVQDADILAHLSPPDLDWHSKVIPLSDQELNAKIEGIACYQSQLSTFFINHDNLVNQITNQIADVGGERLWETSC